ncbi:CsbD family protein [Sciscionella marina]|uniref:CsbD family protein n=1 Tax=Sciscionella marina TaxID=508770 RepID=UPI0003620F66|nr:CsbD family protein [Sciscionella marina]
MSTNDKIDQVTGKLKKTAGKATGDEELESEGQAQHGLAKAKDSVKDAAGKVTGAVRDAVGGDKKDGDKKDETERRR